MKDTQTVSVPLELWNQVKGTLKKLQIPAESGQVQEFLNRIDAVPETPAEKP